MKKSSRVISTLLLGATLTTFSTGVFAVESQKVVKEKLAGATRYETNLAVSAKWEKAETVILVEGYAIPDALAATPLAKQKDAPILLTETSKLTKATADEITRLGAKNAIIVGGEGVVSKEVEKDLEAMNVKVTRLAGQSRFETSEAVVKEMGEVSKVAVVNGYGESDALSIAAPAAKEGMAIVLAGKDELKGSADVVKNAKEKYVIGGEGVVSEKLEKEIGAERLGGATRNETNAAILDKFYSEKEIENLYVAKDGNPKTTELVDALGVGPLAGKEGNPVMLAGAKLSDGQAAYLKDKTAKTVTEVGNGINASTLTDIVKALEVKDVTPSDKVEVEGVKVINANQLVFTFSQKVDKDTAENIKNYEVKTENGLQILGQDNYNTTKAKAEVQEDGQTVVLTLQQAYENNLIKADGKFINQETLKVKVENVMTESKSDVFEKYENKKVKMFDNVLPELKEVKQVGPKDFDLVFSEPVTAASTSSIASAVRIDGGAYTCTATTRADKDVNDKKIGTNVIRLTTGSDVAEGNHTLTIKENKIFDYAGLKLEAVDTKFEAKKATEELKATVYKTSGKTVTVDFNREVENAENYKVEDEQKGNSNVSYYLDYQNKGGYKALAAKMNDGKLELTFDRELAVGDHKILVVYGNEKKDKVQDLWENELATKEIAFTVAKDEVAPTATVAFNKNDKNIEIKFSKKVKVEEAKTASNYILKDSEGKVKNIASIEPKEGNELVYTINAEKLSGKYTLTIKGDKIHDTSVERNAVKEATFELDTLDSKAPQVTSVRFGGDDKDFNKVYVEFSEDMKTEGEGSILDKTLYNLDYNEYDSKNEDGKHIENKNLKDIEDAKIELEGKNAVIITLPENIVGNNVKVKVGRVCDANGNFVAIDGFVNNSMMTTTGDKNTFVAVADSVVDLLDGSKIEDNDILAKDSFANKIDKNKIEVYVRGNITSAVANDIFFGNLADASKSVAEKVNNQCIETKATPVTLELKNNEGAYVNATKLTLKFKEDVENDTLCFRQSALTTMLDTVCGANSKELTLGVQNQVVKYEKGTAKIVVDSNNIAQRVEFKLTAAVQNVNIDTFKVGDGSYNVKSVECKADGTVVLNLDGKSACNAANGDANIDVELVGTLYDTNNNRTTSMDIFQIDTVEEVASIAGTVTTGEGEAATAVAGATVTIKKDGENFAEFITKEDGKFVVVDLKEGTYTVAVIANGYDEGTKTIVVSKDETGVKTVDVTLVKTADVSGNTGENTQNPEENKDAGKEESDSKTPVDNGTVETTPAEETK